jgi:hypothetical protein
MSDELRHLYRAIDALTKRVAKLEAQNRFTTSADWAAMNWWGWCSTTQPASKILNVRGGVFWEWDSAVGTAGFRKLDDTIYDFGGFPPFAAQYHYRWAVLQADVSASPVTLRVFDSGAEFATADLCEADFWANGPAEDLFGAYVPLCAVCLRNDGDLVAAGGIENVTLSDRDYSFLLVRDLRPWLHLHAT